MSFLFRVRLTSFFTGAAMASFLGLYIIRHDHKFAHDSLSNQIKIFHDSLEGRITSLEKLKHAEAPQHAEAPERAEVTE